MLTAERVLVELATVHDPEVDEPVTTMGFIREVEIQGDRVVVHMQLPTFFCAPNFTWLMVDDVKLAAERVAGAGKVTVDLDGHFESERISGSVSKGGTFQDTFGAEAAEDLSGLRDRFLRKTFLIRQERLCRELRPTGADDADLTALTLGEVEALGLSAYEKYHSTREELGIDCRHNSPFLVAADGRPVDPDKLRVHRRSASVMAISFEGNGHLCRSLLSQRYPDQDITRGEVA
jgi:metal-sulfur cluster biosynthetic enzyme